MARRTFIYTQRALVLCFLVLSCPALATSCFGQEGGKGLLSRLRNANADLKSNLRDIPGDSSDENPERRWNPGIRFPMQSFGLPWTNRSSEPQSSIQAPIDLPGTIAPKGRVSATAGTPSNNSNAVGSGLARPTPPEDSSSFSNDRKELRVYESVPSTNPVDPKNTSRRKASMAPAAPKSPAPVSIPKTEPLLDSSNTPSIIPAINASSRSEPTARATQTTEPKEPTQKPRKTTPLDVRSPQLRLRVDGPQSIRVHQSATYTIHATNEGKSELEGLIVRASMPKCVVIDGIKTIVGAYELDETEQDIGVLWEVERLGPNDSKSLEIQIQVLEADQFALNLEWTLAPKATQMTVQVQQPKIELELSGPVDVEVDTPQKYRMNVKNSGSADLPELNLILQTETTSQFESQIGPLAAGSEKVIDVELTFDQEGLFPIVATAQDSSGKLQHRQRVDVQVQKLDLRAAWTGPREFIQGTPTVYELTVENAGGIAASNVDCAIELPEGLEVIQLPEGYSLSSNQIQWSLASIPSGSQFKLPVRCRMNRSGSHALVFRAQSSKNLNLQASITTLVESIADLDLSVKEPQAPAPVGTPVVYEIQVVNRGSKAAENVRVVAQFSEGIEPLNLEGHPGRIVPGQALFEELSQIQPNQTVTLKVICQASKNGVHRFRAAVQSPTSQEDLLEEGSTRFIGGVIRGVAQPSSKP